MVSHTPSSPGWCVTSGAGGPTFPPRPQNAGGGRRRRGAGKSDMQEKGAQATIEGAIEVSRHAMGSNKTDEQGRREQQGDGRGNTIVRSDQSTGSDTYLDQRRERERERPREQETGRQREGKIARPREDGQGGTWANKRNESILAARPFAIPLLIQPPRVKAPGPLRPPGDHGALPARGGQCPPDQPREGGSDGRARGAP